MNSRRGIPVGLSAILLGIGIGMGTMRDSIAHHSLLGVVSVPAYLSISSCVLAFVALGLTFLASERKHQQERDLLKAFLEFIPDNVFFKDLDSRFVCISNAMANYFGLSDPAEAIGKTDADVFSSEHACQALTDEQEVIRTGQPIIEKEEKETWSDGHETWVLTTKVPLRDRKRRIIGTMGIAHNITDRKRAEEAVRKSESQYRLLFEKNPIPMWIFNRQTLGFLAVNRAAVDQYGYSEHEFRRMTIADIRPEESVPDLFKHVANHEIGLQKAEIWKHRRKDGSIVDVEIVSHDLDFGGADAVLVAAYDVTERNRSQETLLFKNALLEAQSEATIDGILAVDERNRIVLANRRFGFQFGVPDELLRAGDDKAVREWMSKRVGLPEDFWERVDHLYRHPEETSRDEFSLNDGRAFDRYSAPLIDSRGGHRGRIWYFREITDRKVAEEQIRMLAYYDAMTGLPNRTLLKDRLTTALAMAARKGEKVAVLAVDLDRFKVINESLGRSFGDQILKEVAERLKEAVRNCDTIARVGGDEFIVLLAHAENATGAEKVSRRVSDVMAQPFRLQGRTVSLNCSVGIAFFPEHGPDAESLLTNAESALYTAKDDGRNTVRVFSFELNEHATEQLTLENDLRLALERDELFLVYQPQLDLATAKIAGIEALIRWQHPRLGLVPPSDFIPVAEKSGLILPIGEWVLRTACSQIRQWQITGTPIVPIAVNVSAVQFRQEDFCALVRNVLNDTGLSPHYLEIELTESLLLSSANVTQSVLRELKEMGITLSIDDFGTGYSSLNYLKQFRVNRLKIDRSFVQGLPEDTDDIAIATAIISMARSLNLRVIAEGVETEAQMAFLREHGCNEIQGYYFSKPLAANQIELSLAERAA